jgi:hypothetical protein
MPQDPQIPEGACVIRARNQKRCGGVAEEVDRREGLQLLYPRLLFNLRPDNCGKNVIQPIIPAAALPGERHGRLQQGSFTCAVFKRPGYWLPVR